MVKAQEASSRARVKGGQGRRQELESAARMFYVFPTPSCQLLLPLPHDGFALSFSLDSLHSKSTERAITSDVGWVVLANWPPFVTQQQQSILRAELGVERRRWEHIGEAALKGRAGLLAAVR